MAISVESQSESCEVKKCSFSIEHILKVAGNSFERKAKSFSEESQFEWLQCTRYKPPKLPRNRKKEIIQKRKLGRNPRIPFSSSQVAFLEAKFLRSPYLSSSDVTQLSNYLQLPEARVKIWFQNRRARERRDRESKTRFTTDKETEDKPRDLRTHRRLEDDQIKRILESNDRNLHSLRNEQVEQSPHYHIVYPFHLEQVAFRNVT